MLSLLVTDVMEYVCPELKMIRPGSHVRLRDRCHTPLPDWTNLFKHPCSLIIQYKD